MWEPSSELTLIVRGIVSTHRCLSSALGCALIDKDDVRDGLQPLLQLPMSEPCAPAGGAYGDAAERRSDRSTTVMAEKARVDPDTLNGLSYDIM